MATSSFDDPVPAETNEAFLEIAPPPWAARGLGSLLIALFAAAALASALVRVPEIVSGPFVLVPLTGTDPVRSPRDGVVARVGAREGESVEKGGVLFVIRSEPVGDRFAELKTLEARGSGAEQSLVHAQAKHTGERLADEEEARRLRSRLESLERMAQIKQKELALAAELAARHKTLHEAGLISWAEQSRPQLEAEKLRAELEQAQAERRQTRATLLALGHQAAARHAEALEVKRALQEEIERARIRSAPLASELADSLGSELSIPAPCAGSVLRLRVRGAGAVVQEADVLCEFACEGEPLQAELRVPDSGVGRLREGLAVKLLYDAFPYQRHGVRYATLRWIGPGADGEAAGGFRVLAEIADHAVSLQGERRPLWPGMGGRAEVVVGGRTLIAYAFEPLRQLRETLAEGPRL